MLFRQVLHEDLGCASYLVGDAGGEAAVIDPQWDIDPYLRLGRLHGVRISHVLETHNHADHVSGHGRLVDADLLCQLTGCVHLLDDVGAAEKLAIDVELGERAPVGDLAGYLAQRLQRRQHVDRAVVHAERVEHLHHPHREPAAGRVRGALHEEQHLVGGDQLLDLLLELGVRHAPILRNRGRERECVDRAVVEALPHRRLDQPVLVDSAQPLELRRGDRRPQVVGGAGFIYDLDLGPRQSGLDHRLDLTEVGHQMRNSMTTCAWGLAGPSSSRTQGARCACSTRAPEDDEMRWPCASARCAGAVELLI